MSSVVQDQASPQLQGRSATLDALHEDAGVPEQVDPRQRGLVEEGFQSRALKIRIGSAGNELLVEHEGAPALLEQAC